MRIRRLQHEQGGASEINVTPLIDVVMCLIIFFLLVGKLSLDATIQLPGTEVGEADAARSITISVLAPDKSGQEPKVLVEGRPIAAGNAGLAEAIATAISAKNAAVPVIAGGAANSAKSAPGASESNASAAAGSSGIAVKLRADKALPYSAIDPVLQACAKAGLASVRLVTERPQ